MDIIKVKDLCFEKCLTSAQIQKETTRVASAINSDYSGQEVVFLSVLNGSFMFASDLLKQIELQCTLSFIKLQSYSGVQSTGNVNQVIGMTGSIKDRHVIILEDIVESGHTMKHLMAELQKQQPRSVQICALLFKPEKLETDIQIKYVGFRMGSEFLVGYGLDYDEYGRNLPDIYSVTDNQENAQL